VWRKITDRMRTTAQAEAAMQRNQKIDLRGKNESRMNGLKRD
jgi:hypothetical protein